MCSWEMEGDLCMKRAKFVSDKNMTRTDKDWENGVVSLHFNSNHVLLKAARAQCVP